MRCTVTIFGKPLADLPEADANCVRSFVADLDDCPACAAVTERRRIFTDAARDPDFQVWKRDAEDQV